jgi:hypothetical protein
MLEMDCLATRDVCCFGSAFYLGVAIFDYTDETEKIRFVGSEHVVKADVGEMLEAGFVKGDEVIFGYEDDGNNKITFIVKSSETDEDNLTEELDELELCDIEEYIADKFDTAVTERFYYED